MSVSDFPLRIVQLSDIHCGEPTFQEEGMRSIVERVNRMQPDVIVVAGDLTAAGYEWEFEEVAEWLDKMEPPKVVIPGNHDSRNVGYIHFKRLFGDRFNRYRQAFDPVRAERLAATASGEAQRGYINLARQWSILADEIENGISAPAR